jgi:hypothetical protein
MPSRKAVGKKADRRQFIADLAEGRKPRKARSAAESGGADRHEPRIFIGNNPQTTSPEFSDRNDFRRRVAWARKSLPS